MSLEGQATKQSQMEGVVSSGGTLQGDMSNGGIVQGNASESKVIVGHASRVNIIYSDAYKVAVQNGFQGTVGEWLASIKGEDGEDGYTPVAGTDYYTEAERDAIVSDVLNILVGTMKAAKIGTITLLADAWEGANNLYSQVVSVDGATEYSQVDITPSVEQLAVFYEKDITFVTENEDGVVTVYAIGQKPTNDYTVQVTITEVSV